MSKITKELKKKVNPLKAKILTRFFKTGKGEYGEGDLFLGITVPEVRNIALEYIDTSLAEIEKLLKNKYHEIRLAGLLLLVIKYKKGNEKEKINPPSHKVTARQVFDLYLKNTKYINNWDLVDLTAPNIIGDYLLFRKRNILYKLARSKSLWERRIAIVATLAFIRQKQYLDTFQLCEILLNDSEDLIHKSCGWMLREVGKRDKTNLDTFLYKHASVMPRTMLRYAIENKPESERKEWLKIKKVNNK